MYILGVDPVNDISATPKHREGSLGANVTSAGVKIYIYVRANGAITGDGYVCDIDGSNYDAAMCTTTTTAPGTGAGKPVGVARAAFADNDYGWLQVFGPGTVRTLASCAAYTIINSTATAGALDDDATSGAEVIDGLVLDVATGGAAASTAGFINWPRVGRTL